MFAAINHMLKFGRINNATKLRAVFPVPDVLIFDIGEDVKSESTAFEVFDGNVHEWFRRPTVKGEFAVWEQGGIAADISRFLWWIREARRLPLSHILGGVFGMHMERWGFTGIWDNQIKSLNLARRDYDVLNFDYVYPETFVGFEGGGGVPPLKECQQGINSSKTSGESGNYIQTFGDSDLSIPHGFLLGVVLLAVGLPLNWYGTGVNNWLCVIAWVLDSVGFGVLGWSSFVFLGQHVSMLTGIN